MSTVFNIVFDIPTTNAIVLSFALILGFTILGGLVATIVTDAIQSIIVIFGIIVLAAASIGYAGGLGEAILNTPKEYISPIGANGLSDVLIFALTVGPFYMVWQSTWQRIFASKSESVAVKAGMTGFLIALAISVLPFTIGVIARQFVPLDMRPDLVFSYVTFELLSPQVGGIVIVGLLAALMTGADSFILQGSSNLAQDFYHRLINTTATEYQKLTVARLSVVIISVLALIVAYFVNDIVTLYQWALRLTATTLVFPFLAVMFWKKATGKVCVVSMAIASVATIFWPYLGTDIDPVFPEFIASILGLWIISYFTDRSKNEYVAAVYWEDLPSSQRE